MKRLFLYTLLISIAFFTACSPSQKISASWFNPEFKAKAAYSKIFVIALTQDNTNKYTIENKIGKLLKDRGRKVVMSYEKFPPASFTDNKISKESIERVVKETGCDAIFTITLLNVKTETRYQPGTTTYAPSMHGGYYGYYGYYQPMVYTPGYYVTDKTYYIESNLYDTKTDQMMWSIQSSAYNPSDFNKWFQGYSRLIFDKLKREGLYKK